MNQAIQVLDGCRYVESRKALKVELISAGQILSCYISGQSEEHLLALYDAQQFDIEDVIEQQLEEENTNMDGEICFDAKLVISN
jgi:hypothetical protein